MPPGGRPFDPDRFSFVVVRKYRERHFDRWGPWMGMFWLGPKVGPLFSVTLDRLVVSYRNRAGAESQYKKTFGVFPRRSFTRHVTVYPSGRLHTETVDVVVTTKQAMKLAVPEEYR